ncbi:MAG: glycine zipper 2TM domain-containing protein [Nevskiales bacterium]
MRHSKLIKLSILVLLLGSGLASAETEPVCGNCGTISAIEKKTEKGEGTGVGVATGAVLGAVAGREIVGGKRSHRNAAAVVGAVAGGYAGNEVEKNVRSTDYYAVSVRMDSDQPTETVRLESAEGWTIGDKVRVEDGKLVRR